MNQRRSKSRSTDSATAAPAVPPARRNLKRVIGLIVAGSVLVVLGIVGRHYLNRVYSAPLKLQAAYASWAQGQHGAAEESAWQAYQLNPELTEAALFAAEIAANSQRYSQAIEYASQVTSADSETRLKAYQLLAHIAHHRTFQLSQAETYYRLALGINSDDIETQTGLANLLGLCGRRPEAVPLILNLIRLGSPSELLILLAREDTVINDQATVEKARQAAPDDPLPLIAQAWHAADQGQHIQAIDKLREALKHNSHLEAAQLLILKYLAASGQFDDLRREIVRLAPAHNMLETWAEYWLVCGQLAEFENRKSEAIRCYGEAALRAPDSKMAAARLAALLHQQGDDASAKVFETYSQNLQRLRDAQEQVFFAVTSPNAATLESMLSAYVDVGRIWEALGWCRTAVASNPSLRLQLAARQKELEELTASEPLSLVPPKLSPCRYLDLSKYPIPAWKSDAPLSGKPLAENQPTSTSTISVTFRDDALSVGLDFRYKNGVQGTPQRRMYEFPGGGIAVLDLDQDGRPDLALSQGTPWPVEINPPEYHDVLIRNIDGQRFVPIPDSALGIQQFDGFGQGIATGDVNSDGYADLYVAQIGQNRLLINNGDGTFCETTSTANIRDQQWTTSCLVADLSGDGLPDIYDVNYVQGKDVFERICVDHTGQPAMCMPGDFDAAVDVLWINQGDGTFANGTARLLSPPDGKGLGCLAFSQPGSTGLSLLIANDTTPNFLYVPGRGSDGELQWTETGVAAGLAFNGSGKAQGCMGIAVDDMNADGQPDFVITNFLNESCTFYSGQSDGAYRDDTVAANLIEPTRNVLGFGTQFVDADNDGTSELFMANGHIDDLSRRNVPYQMPPQLYRYQRGKFQLLPSRTVGEYFQQQWIGRSVVRLDWNDDGRPDLAVGHLDSPYALLTNTSAPVGHWLNIQLVGTRSNRDAIGTRVTVTAGGIRKSAQLTAGDGYMSSNQRQLHFGLGTAEKIDEIEVMWPSGQRQPIEPPKVDSQLLIVEP